MKILDKLQRYFQPAASKSIPMFDKSPSIRMHFQFYGIVQGVGFRYEVYQMANTLKLTGWVKNNTDGSVSCELQGEKDRIDYLIENLKKISRIHINHIEQKQIPYIEEKCFKMGN